MEAAVIAAVESFALGDGRGKGFKETICTLWGTRQRSGDRETDYFIQLERCHTALSAERTAASVYQSLEARHLAESVMSSFQPTMVLFGDLHTHPYPSYDDVKYHQGWEFSKGDFKAFMNDDDLWRDETSTPIMAVIAICEMKRVRESERKFKSPSVMEFNVGDFRLWLNLCIGWTDEDGTRRNTIHDETQEDGCTIWPDPYFNPGSLRIKGG